MELKNKERTEKLLELMNKRNYFTKLKLEHKKTVHLQYR